MTAMTPISAGRRRTGTNLPRVGDYNQMLVLDLIRRSGEISRVELVRETGLTAQTMSNICRRLEEAQLIRGAGRHYGGMGAPRVMFEVRPEGRYALGLHIDPARLTLVVINLAGVKVASRTIASPERSEPEAMLAEIERLAHELIAECSIPEGRLAGMGVATPGPLDAEKGIVVDAPNLPGWENVRLKEELERRLSVNVIIEKDSTAAAVGEQWALTDSHDSFAFVYLGTGVSAGIVLGGEVMRGFSSNIGDIGHLSGDPNGPICHCGGRGCLASTAMPVSIVAEGTAQGALPAVDLADPRAVERALWDLSVMAQADPLGPPAEILIRVAKSYGRVVGQLANVLDLEAVVFGGPQWAALESTFLRVIPPVVSRLFVGRQLHEVLIRGSKVGEDSGAYGAASLSMWSTTFSRDTHLTLGDARG